MVTSIYSLPVKKYRVLLGLFFALSILSRQITGASGAQVEIFNQTFLQTHQHNIAEKSIHVNPTNTNQLITEHNKALTLIKKTSKEVIYKKYKTQDLHTNIDNEGSYKLIEAPKLNGYSSFHASHKPIFVNSLSPPYVSDLGTHSLTKYSNGGIVNHGLEKSNCYRGISLFSCWAS